MTLEEKVDKGLMRIVLDAVDDCRYIVEHPSAATSFTWEEVQGDWEDDYPADTPVLQAMIYGSSYGPDLQRIICRDIGLEEAEAEEVADWDLVTELEEAIDTALSEEAGGPGGYVFIDDNCIFWRKIEEAEEDA